MTIITFSILLLFFSFIAGLLGALTGLGGGVVVIPVLVLLFHINIHYAMGASLISVMATSSGTAAAYLREGYTNLRIGIFLETGAVIGALIGASLVAVVPKTFLAVLFSFVLFFSAYLTIRRKEDHESFSSSHPWAVELKLNGSYPQQNRIIPYSVQHVPYALTVMGLAGIFSGLLGIGSGALKVLAMDQALRLPYKVATTTSNFMIGITAAASAGIYFSDGYIHPTITFPVMIGVIMGSFFGARILTRLHHRTLRVIFSMVICIMGLQMLYKAMTGAI
ncbi:MAG: sulfite exporter TauE/SafE family protein [Gammaproteobacteria bacterium]|nr:MAG: sulfite exporter TauE/SafE family protein [Gammaproteobacteria bacterium]